MGLEKAWGSGTSFLGECRLGRELALGERGVARGSLIREMASGELGVAILPA